MSLLKHGTGSFRVRRVRMAYNWMGVARRHIKLLRVWLTLLCSAGPGMAFLIDLFLFRGQRRRKGWGAHSRKALVNTLQSSLVIPDERKTRFGVQQYITILAIAGPFYQHYKQAGIGCAFPYRDRPFILQFQAWWNQFLDSDGKPVVGQTKDEQQGIIDQAVVENRRWSNLAEDWIEACRDADIPGSGGAFISFKDDAIKTSTYFADNFKRLCNIKASYSQDNNHLFTTRKTVFSERD